MFLPPVEDYIDRWLIQYGRIDVRTNLRCRSGVFSVSH